MATKTPNPNDVLRLGQNVATIKANMPAKRWRKFVKYAHARGHTIAGELTDGPNALKERTASSLRAEAQRSVAAAYAPATKALDTRTAAIGYLDDKRKTDDAAYRTWLTGETDKLNAQAAAADATLASQQSGIAAETKTAIDAARADSIARMQQNAGNVSNPAQSAALDTSAADTAATQHIQAARDQTAALTKIGGDSRTLASASLLAQQGAREATRIGDTYKALGEVASDRNKLLSDQAGATADKTDALLQRNVQITQANRDSQLAGASLGLKQDTLAQQVSDANRKYKLASAQFGLDKWKAQNADAVARAKVQLGYDHIKSTEGIAAANRKLNAKLAKLKAHAQANGKAGVTKDERNLYKDIVSAQGRVTRWTKLGMPPDQITAKLRGLGADDVTIQIAEDLAANHGTISPSAAALARQLGIKHVGYFFNPLPTPQGNLGLTGHQ